MARKLDILIAEDDADDAALIRAAIRIHGIKKAAIHSVPDGHKAIAYLEGLGEFSNRRKYPFPNLIVSALKMPRLSAFELFEWLRNHPGCPVAPIFLVSGNAFPDNLVKAFRLGPASVLEKPNSVENLAHLLGVRFRFPSTGNQAPPR